MFAHLTDRGVELAKKLAHGGKVHRFAAALLQRGPCNNSKAGASMQLAAHRRAAKLEPHVLQTCSVVLQGHTAKDFLRRLKAQYVSSSQAQDDGADDPSAFNWAQMGFDVGHMFRPVPGIFCMVGAAVIPLQILHRDSGTCIVGAAQRSR